MRLAVPIGNFGALKIGGHNVKLRSILEQARAQKTDKRL